MNSKSTLLFGALTLCTLVSCTKSIPNTTVDDTAANRDIVAFLEQYRHAVEERDVAALGHMASPDYLDDNGTPTGEDDLDYTRLRAKLASWADRVEDVRYEIKYLRVTEDDAVAKIFVEFRYSASFLVGREGSEDRWERRLGDHRLVLRRNGDSFVILAGM